MYLHSLLSGCIVAFRVPSWLAILVWWLLPTPPRQAKYHLLGVCSQVPVSELISDAPCNTDQAPQKPPKVEGTIDNFDFCIQKSDLGSKNEPQGLQKWAPRAQMTSKAPKMIPRPPKVSPATPKITPKAPKLNRKCFQGSKNDPRIPQITPEAPKMTPLGWFETENEENQIEAAIP